MRNPRAVAATIAAILPACPVAAETALPTVAPVIVLQERGTWDESYVGLLAGRGEADGSLGTGVEFDSGLSFDMDQSRGSDGGFYGLRTGIDRELLRFDDGVAGFDRVVGGLVLDLRVGGPDAGGPFTRATTVPTPPCGGVDGGSECGVVQTGGSGADVDGIATLRGRFGIASERAFLYATGGLGYAAFGGGGRTTTRFSEDAAEGVFNGGAEITGSTPLPAGCRALPDPDPGETPVLCTAGGGADDGFGPVLGLGVEYRLGEDVSIGAEYLHMEFEAVEIDSVSLNLNIRF